MKRIVWDMAIKMARRERVMDAMQKGENVPKEIQDDVSESLQKAVNETLEQKHLSDQILETIEAAKKYLTQERARDEALAATVLGAYKEALTIYGTNLDAAGQGQLSPEQLDLAGLEPGQQEETWWAFEAALKSRRQREIVQAVYSMMSLIRGELLGLEQELPPAATEPTFED